MASTYTDNFELEKQGVGDNSGTWGDPTLNQNVIARIDAAMGVTTTVALVSSNVTLTQAQWRSKCIKLTGALGANIVISLPLSVNSVGSATAVGGEIIFDNETSGAFTITVKTAATASTGVEIPQGFRSTLYSDTLNVTYADDQGRSTVLTYAGNPNGNVAGTAGSSTTPASVIFDRTNQVYYICTTSGVAAVAVWTAISAPTVAPQGYLTASSSTSAVILTGDSIGATRLYYSQLVGASVPIFNGTSFVPVPFSQMTLDLTASQAAGGIYDAVLFLDSGVLTIGFSPSWSAGTGGSVTAGSCARGTGAGGAAIQRLNGIWVNTAAMTVNNGVTTYSVAAQRGTVVGSVFVDATQGQVTCHRTWGQSRKWGVSNIYNRQQIILQMGDSTATWSYGTATIRQSNGSALNTLAVFSAIAEEPADLRATQSVAFSTNAAAAAWIGVGVNSTTAMSGKRGQAKPSAVGSEPVCDMLAQHVLAPSLGFNNINFLELGSGTNTSTFQGGNDDMILTASWRA